MFYLNCTVTKKLSIPKTIGILFAVGVSHILLITYLRNNTQISKKHNILKDVKELVVVPASDVRPSDLILSNTQTQLNNPLDLLKLNDVKINKKRLLPNYKKLLPLVLLISAGTLGYSLSNHFMNSLSISSALPKEKESIDFPISEKALVCSSIPYYIPVLMSENPMINQLINKDIIIENEKENAKSEDINVNNKENILLNKKNNLKNKKNNLKNKKNNLKNRENNIRNEELIIWQEESLEGLEIITLEETSKKSSHSLMLMPSNFIFSNPNLIIKINDKVIWHNIISISLKSISQPIFNDLLAFIFNENFNKKNNNQLEVTNTINENLQKETNIPNEVLGLEISEDIIPIANIIHEEVLVPEDFLHNQIIYQNKTYDQQIPNKENVSELILTEKMIDQKTWINTYYYYASNAFNFINTVIVFIKRNIIPVMFPIFFFIKEYVMPPILLILLAFYYFKGNT